MHNPEPVGGTRRFPLPHRWWTKVAVAAIVLVAIAVPAAWASHLFADVPDSSPHHDDISAIFGVRITTGCTPSLYCPTDPVTRQQMATFLRRGLGRTGASGSTAGITLTSTYADIAQDSITLGGAPGGTGRVVLMGDFSAVANSGVTVDHRVEFQLIHDNTGFTSNDSTMTLTPSNGGLPSAAGHKTWTFSAATGTTQTFSLQARVAFPSPPTSPISAESRLITLMYVPFGPSGTSSFSSSQGTPGSPERVNEGK